MKKVACVSPLDIAKRLEVKKDTVNKWRSRHKDFPEPAFHINSVPVYDWEEVKEWSVRTNHPRKKKSMG